MMIAKHIALMYDENGALPLSYVQVTQLGRQATSDELKSLLDAVDRFVPSYNDFDSKTFRKAIVKNRRKIYTVRFGREYSPAVYIRPMFSGDEKMAKALMLTLAAELKASEYALQESSHIHVDGKDLSDEKKSYEIRLWWD